MRESTRTLFYNAQDYSNINDKRGAKPKFIELDRQ